jgi:hypothetical protein
VTGDAAWAATCALACAVAWWSLSTSADLAARASSAAVGASRTAAEVRRLRLEVELARELAASCARDVAADVDVAHARAARLEVALRAVAATSACRERLPDPFPIPPRPLWCEGPDPWAAPLPTPGASCYPPEARVGP